MNARQKGDYKNIFIMHTHWNNRGDEAANRAMVDELHRLCPDINMTIQLASIGLYGTDVFHSSNCKVLSHRFPRSSDFFEAFLMYLTKGRVTFSKDGREFIDILRNSDIVVHAPGGPAIGDIYSKAELAYLCRLLLAVRLRKPVFIYAPSIGPFNNRVRNVLRKYVLKRACCITFREDISAGYFHRLLPKKPYTVTLDSAFQNDIEIIHNQSILNNDADLCNFLNRYDKVVGITITDLQWNPKYKGNIELSENIRNVFKAFIKFLEDKGYGIIFIPQLFGAADDRIYMNGFSSMNTFTLTDKYDCYFQQFLISKLYAVVGMRYHSNIFSCKMGVPFISVTYEQKMKGFMNEQNLNQYCIDVTALSYECLIGKYLILEKKYDNYRKVLKDKSTILKSKAQKTTELLLQQLGKGSRL